MTAVDNSGLPLGEADALRALLSVDQALADELELIVDALAADVRRAFWRAFVDDGGLSGRPAAAVLTALVRASGSKSD